MKLLVCSGVSFPALNRFLPDWSLLGSEHSVSFDECTERPDAVLCMSINRVDHARYALGRWPDVPLFVYHWDCYSWVWTRPRPHEYNYQAYGELLKEARRIWVPSLCTALQAGKWWGVESKVVWPSCPYWDADQVEDRGYALCTLRAIPDDCVGWFEKTCQELNIPCVTPNHDLGNDNYRNVVENCRLIVSTYREASTGGLSLLEAYHLGKRVLISDSPLNGANEYFGRRASKFPYNDYIDFRERLRVLWQCPDSWEAPSDCKEWVEKNFNDQRMLNEILEDVHANA